MLRATARPVCEAFAQTPRAYWVPQTVLTRNGRVFSGRAARSRHEVLFDRICRENGDPPPAHRGSLADHHGQDRDAPALPSDQAPVDVAEDPVDHEVASSTVVVDEDPFAHRVPGERVIRRIREHNELNGVLFSSVEYGVAALAAAFVAFGFGRNKRWLGVLLGGIALNCVVVLVFGLAALRRGERGQSLRSLSDAEYRQRLRREHPDLMRDTLTLAGLAIIPYALALRVAVDAVRTGT
jgi:hypothetical protein